MVSPERKLKLLHRSSFNGIQLRLRTKPLTRGHRLTKEAGLRLYSVQGPDSRNRRGTVGTVTSAIQGFGLQIPLGLLVLDPHDALCAG